MFSYIFSLLNDLMHFILGISSAGFPPPLSASEEEKYFYLMKNGDERAREKLILHNLRLVSHIVRKYYSSSPQQEDLVSVGSIGLVKAVDTFNADNGARFATYAARCIQNEILMYFRSQKKLTHEISINETIDIDRDGNPLTYGDVISSDECIPEDIDTKIKVDQAMKYVNTVLSSREREIIIMRYGLYGVAPLTQREAADKLKISRSYVSRIEKCALEKLLAAFDQRQ